MTYIYEKTLGETNGNTNFTGDKLIVEYIHSSVSDSVKVVEMWRVGEDWSGEVKKQEHQMTWMSHESRASLIAELEEDMTDKACKTGEFDMDTYAGENPDFDNAINGVS